MADSEVEETEPPEPFWPFVSDLFWVLFKRAIFALLFLGAGYYYGYCAGYDDFRLALKEILQQGKQSAPPSGYEETL